MKKTINENLEILQELIRKVDSLISPMTVDSKLKWLMSKDVKNKLFETHPKCFLTMNIGQKSMVFPVCNRSGMEDPDIIAISLKVANKLAGRSNINNEELVVILKKLEMLQRKFSKDIPKPSDMAVRKGMSTKEINQIKSILNR